MSDDADGIKKAYNYAGPNAKCALTEAGPKRDQSG